MLEKKEDSIGKRIQQARTTCGMSQTDLARKLGIKPQAVQHWERGTSLPKMGRINELAKALDVQPSWLLHNDTLQCSHTLTDTQLNQDETLLVSRYRRMDASRRKIFSEIAVVLSKTIK